MIDYIKKRPHLVSVVAIVPLLALSAYFAIRPNVRLASEDDENLDYRREKVQNIGGVDRPYSDLQSLFGAPTANSSRDRLSWDEENHPIGKFPDVPENANRAASLVSEAMRTGAHPERLTPMIQPETFDLERYKGDQQSYLQSAEPGRVWQTAQPGNTVPVLKRAVPQIQQIVQGESIRLKVIGAPNAPVSFASLDAGAFQNQLTAVTVAADNAGLAEATFTGIRGTIGDVNILVGSPLAAEQVQFIVRIVPRGLAQETER